MDMVGVSTYRVTQQVLNLTDGEAMAPAEVETYRRERQRKGKGPAA